jgi:hypothetical protein
MTIGLPFTPTFPKRGSVKQGIVARVLTGDGAPSRTSAMFYPAIVQSTLLWGRGVGCDRPGLEGLGGAFIIGRRDDGFRAACCTSAGRVREFIEEDRGCWGGYDRVVGVDPAKPSAKKKEYYPDRLGGGYWWERVVSSTVVE